MRIIIISEQALRKAVPSAKQRAAVRKTSFAVVSASKIKAFTDKFFSGIGAFAESKAQEFTDGQPFESKVKFDRSAERLQEIYPEIISWPLVKQSMYADDITRKNASNGEWGEYHHLLNITEKRTIDMFDAQDIANLAHMAQYSPPDNNHIAQGILNDLKNEFHARTENNSKVN